MSVFLYDKAVLDKFREITQDSRIYINPTDNVFRTVSMLDNDNVKLPMISIMRTGTTILDNVSYPLMKTGTLAKVNQDEEYFTRVQAIPIQINYLIDIWTKTRLDNDNIVREIIFYFFTHPTLQIEIPYTINVKHNFNLFLNKDIEDNSDVLEHKNRGEMYRQTLTMYTNDAYLWKASRTDFLDITLDVEVSAGSEIIDT